MAAVIKSTLVFGITEQKPLVGFPEGRARVRLRNNEFSKVFIRDAKSTRGFHIKEHEGAWIPGPEFAANLR